MVDLIKDGNGHSADSSGVTENADVPTLHISYDGVTGALARIVAVNSLLNLVTLGIYRFWGKTRVRRYLWRHVALNRDAFEYTGTGKELFTGFAIVFAIFAPIILTYSVFIEFYGEAFPITSAILEIIYMLAIFFLIGVAIYRARRYRLSRTLWRGIRFAQIGSAARYGGLWMGYLLLAFISMGIAMPMMHIGLEHYRMNNTLMGNRTFQFDGRAGDLMGRWMLNYFLFLPTLGLSYFWYKARQLNYVAAHTRFGNLRFSLDISGKNLLGIYFLYIVSLIALFLIGLLIVGSSQNLIGMAAGGEQGTVKDVQEFVSIIFHTIIVIGSIVILLMIATILYNVLVVQRFLRLLCSRLTISGEEDFDAIAQDASDMPKRAEGLADFLDVGGL